MENLRRFRGVICPLLTPFDTTGHIDDNSLANLLDYVIDGGVHGVMIAGTTGEGMLLTMDERKHLTQRVIDLVAGRASVISHVGCVDTASTIELAKHAVECGTDAISAIVPYFFTYDDESIYAHFKAISDVLPHAPLFPYVFPGNAKNDIRPEMFKRMVAELPSVVGIKSSNPDLFKLRGYVNADGGNLSIFCGVDGLMLPGLIEGTCGQVSGNANVFPGLLRNLYDSFHKGDLDAARELQAKIDRIRAVLRDGLYIAYFKVALQEKGIIAHSTVRRPMRDLVAAEYRQLVDELAALNGYVGEIW